MRPDRGRPPVCSRAGSRIRSRAGRSGHHRGLDGGLRGGLRGGLPGGLHGGLRRFGGRRWRQPHDDTCQQAHRQERQRSGSRHLRATTPGKAYAVPAPGRPPLPLRHCLRRRPRQDRHFTDTATFAQPLGENDIGVGGQRLTGPKPDGDRRRRVIGQDGRLVSTRPVRRGVGQHGSHRRSEARSEQMEPFGETRGTTTGQTRHRAPGPRPAGQRKPGERAHPEHVAGLGGHIPSDHLWSDETAGA